MSRQAEAFRAAYEAFSRGDHDAALAAIDPEFEVRDRIIPEVVGKRGPAALIENVRMVREVFGEVTYEPREFVELDDAVLIRVHATVVGAAHTGLSFDMDIGQLWTLREGRAIALDIYRTWDEARAAAGLED